MAINDRFMLPKRVRTMKQMADLLAAEQAELDLTQRTIAALENQLIISTSTIQISRHERLFGLPVNVEDNLMLRRARVLAKLNMRRVTSAKAIQELAEIITGCKSCVEEHFEKYAFSVILYLEVFTQNAELRELIRQIHDVKPAHLVFDILGKFPPAVFRHRHQMRLYCMIIQFRFSHIRRPWVRFDGEVSFDGSILFDQTPAGIRLPRFGVRVRFVELCRRAVRFDGEAGFDGTIQFDQTISSTGISTFGILARLSHKTALSGPDVRLSALRIPEKPGRAGIPRMTVTAALPRHKVQTGGTVTMDNWRGMAGDIAFDGNYKFDAYLVKEEL